MEERKGWIVRKHILLDLICLEFYPFFFFLSTIEVLKFLENIEKIISPDLETSSEISTNHGYFFHYYLAHVHKKNYSILQSIAGV